MEQTYKVVFSNRQPLEFVVKAYGFQDAERIAREEMQKESYEPEIITNRRLDDGAGF